MDNYVEVVKVIRLRSKGQSIIEYVIIFAVVAVLSVALLFKGTIQGIFSSYVNKATGAMK